MPSYRPAHARARRSPRRTAVGAAFAVAASIVTAMPASAATASFSGKAGSAHPWTLHEFTVGSAAAHTITLTWSNRSTNLQLGLRKKGASSWIAWSAKPSGASESLQVELASGTYELGIASKSGADSAYSLKVAQTPATAPTPPPPDSSGPVRVAEHRMYYEIESKTHNWTYAQAVAQARSFDVIVAGMHTYTPQMVQGMHNANPALQLVIYSNGTLAQTWEKDTYPNSWYLKDKNGRKIQNDWKLWLMDPANPGWVKNRANQCKDFLARSGFDACYLDNMGYGFIKYNPLTGKPINPRTKRQYTYPDWQRDTTNATKTINSLVAKPIVVNGIVDGSVYFGNPSSKPLLLASDAALSEVFLRASTQSPTWVPSEQAWKQDLDMLTDAVRAGKPMYLTTKVWSKATADQLTRWRNLSQATFLLGTDGAKSAMHFSGSRYEAWTPSEGQLSKVGRPTAAYKVTNGVYSRTFSAGIAVVNPTSTSKTFVLGAAYRRQSGAMVTKITLAPMTGEILTK